MIGLQFVVLTLIAQRPPARAAEGAAAFGTPTIVHFGAALLLSALLRIPWESTAALASLCGVAGVIGLIYTLTVTWRMHKQNSYRPEFEDWLCHAALPLAAYATLVVAAFGFFAYMHEALLSLGATVLLLLFIGIHNAWDAVTYHVFVQRQDKNKEL